MTNETSTNDHNSVLIIDDDIELCKALSIVINKAGYTTYIANNGQAGMEMLHKESPTVIVLDLRMQGMDGIDVLKQIKKISSKTPVIIITAYGKIQSVVEAVKLGAYDYLVVDCGSIPETLIESELFGYEKGAFTGAERQKPGRFENASGGTLFLDEIGSLPASMQGKLLRVIQERRVRRLSGNMEIAVDVRVIVAGNEQLESLVKSGRFRMDLYQRLNEFHIEIPPLRKRKDDVVFLSKGFLDATNVELKKQVRGFTKEALDILLEYNWPGNVRELRNVIRRAVLLSPEMIEPTSLPALTNAPKPAPSFVERSGSVSHLQTKNENVVTPAEPASAISGAGEKPKQTISVDVDMGNDKDFSLNACIKNVERQLIENALICTRGNKSI